MNSANSNAKVKEATEKLMNAVNNSTCGHCFHPLPSWGHTNLQANSANHSEIKSLSLEKYQQISLAFINLKRLSII